MLDDKSFVSKVKDQIIAQAYSSELDEEDDSEGESTPKSQNSGLEDQLMQAYIKDPTVFERSNNVRQSAGRKALCERLKMTHEQLEGWAIMFSRNVHTLEFVSLCLFCSLGRTLSCKIIPLIIT